MKKVIASLQMHDGLSCPPVLGLSFTFCIEVAQPVPTSDTCSLCFCSERIQFIELPFESFYGSVAVLSAIGFRWQRLDVPDHLSIFVDATVAGEETHSGNRSDRLGQPLLLVLVRFINEVLSVNVALEVVGHKVIVAMIHN